MKILIQEQHTNRYKYGTKGQLNGNIEHNNFADWKLDLAINSKDFGIRPKTVKMQRITTFIDGMATIKEKRILCFIKVDAKSEKEQLKIPINNAESVSDNVFLHL
jgi:hypothetical protein